MTMKILNYIMNLNGYDFSILLIVLVTFDIWAALYARSKSKGLVSDSWHPVQKYLVSILPGIIWFVIELLKRLCVMTSGGEGMLFVVMVLITFWLAFSEFISITSFLAIAEPKAFKWAQKFAISYALPEIQKKMLKLDIKAHPAESEEGQTVEKKGDTK